MRIYVMYICARYFYLSALTHVQKAEKNTLLFLHFFKAICFVILHNSVRRLPILQRVLERHV